jgi:hypothetical protein
VTVTGVHDVERVRPGAVERALHERALPKLARAAERVALRAARPAEDTGCRLGIVIVGWDGDRTEECVGVISDRMKTCAGVEAEIVVVANRPSAVRGLPSSVGVAGGSNSSYEFGGYDEGLAWLDARSPLRDCYLVMNDRALAHEPNVLSNLTPGLIRFAARTGVVAQVDSFLDGRSHDVLGTVIRSWARSSAILLSGDARRRVGTMTSITAGQLERYVPASFPGLGWALPDAATIDPDYATFVHAWLTGERLRLRSAWYGAAPVSDAAWPTYRRKIHAILNEHRWSARCYCAQVPIVPVRSAEILAEFAPDSTRLCDLLSELRDDPERAHRFVLSWWGRIRVSRSLAMDALAARRAELRPVASRGRGAVPQS